MREERREVRTGHGRLQVIATSSQEMAQLAAERASELIRAAVERHGAAHVAFAAAPSQTAFLAQLRQQPAVPWAQVTAFQLDEYVGLPEGAAQRFSAYLDDALWHHVPLREAYILDPGGLAPEETCRRYALLLRAHPLHLACLGIGENGHLAFNDPHVADFEDPLSVKVVELDEACRQQQVNDGCFPSLREVPRQAVTLTMPTLFAAEAVVCVVPGARKRRTVQAALYGVMSPACPASLLRRHPNATLFLDEGSARGQAH